MRQRRRTTAALVASFLALPALVVLLIAGWTSVHTTAMAEVLCCKTTSAGQCGTDIDLAPVVCGGATCYQTRITYGTIHNCEDSGSHGRKKCCTEDCNRTTYTQSCVGSVCELVETTVEAVTPSTIACGDPCQPPVPVDPEQ
jgi:hypothetical protein